MLHKLRINNIALISELEIQFDSGFNVLSGETGAGKSIIIDSINFILGAKADKTLIKSGQSRAFCEAIFYLNPQIKQKLQEKDLDFADEDDELIIYRAMSANGKTDNRINGKTVNNAILKAVMSEIVDLHGQHEHQSLLNSDNHINILDYYVTHSTLQNLLFKSTQQYSELLTIKNELKSFGGSEAERARAADMLEYQIHEISTLNPSQQEEDDLRSKMQRIIHLEKILSSLSEADALLGGEAGATAMVSRAVRCLSVSARFDSQVEELLDRLHSLRIELDDISETVSSYGENLDFDPNDADKIQAKLDKYKEVKRKYGGSIEEVLSYLQNSKTEYERLQNAAATIAQLTQNKQAIVEQLYQTSLQISCERKRIAIELQKAIVEQLADLGMSGAQFEVVFQPIPQDYESKLTARGLDKVEFFLSANKGEPLKPLSKIISGGEMSRIMLALKVIAGQSGQISTMIFDEIDTGISGKIGQKVAEKLAKISRSAQVLCVTHLAQIAAMADKQFLITKSESQDKTHTNVIELNEEQLIQEIARLSGAQGISDFATQSAKQMKEWCDSYKKNLQ